MSASTESASGETEVAAGAVDVGAITYASAAKTRGGRAVVRTIENLTGRIPLLYRLWGFEADVAAGASIWDVMTERYRVSLDVDDAELAHVPASGPAVVVANHPYGILDALCLGAALHRRRRDFRILANAIFMASPEVAPFILPVDFDAGREAVRRNLQMRQDAARHLRDGGALALFPAGATSTVDRAFGPAFDPDWKPFAVRLMREVDAPAVPLLFDGANSRLFHVAGRLHPTLRTALYMREFNRRVGRAVRIRIGAPIAPSELADASAPDAAQILRARTYALSDDPERGGYGSAGPPFGPRFA